MYYREIKNRQKVEVACGDPSKLHLVLNFFREPTPLERFRYASTIHWKLGTVVEKYRFIHTGKPCDIDYTRVHFNKNKESLRIRPLNAEVPHKDLSGVRAALASDPWVLPICIKDADEWSDEDLDRFGKDFYCKHFGRTLESIKANEILAVINDF